MPKHHALALFLDVEEVHGLADLAVVALLGLLDALDVGLQVGLGGPGRTIYPLQLGVAMIAAPIGAGQLGQLEGLAHMARGRQVRTQAQVLPAALPIDADLLGLRQVLDDLGLVGLADAAEVLQRLVAVPDLPADRLVALDDLAHLGFDLLEVVEAEGLVAGEVVIEAVLDGRANGHLGAGEQLLHRLGQHVGGVVADGLQHLGILPREDLEGAAVVQGPLKVQQLAVQLYQHGLLLQGLGDPRGDLAAGHAGLEGPFGTVGKYELDHVSHVHLRAGGSSERPGGGGGGS